jgi:hypothetical protein
MNLLMTATPLAMDFCSHPYSLAAMVISWHVVGMYAPGFVTGSLINRFGVLNCDPRRCGGDGLRRGNRADRCHVRPFRRGAGADRPRLEFHVHGRHHVADRGVHAGGKARTQGANDFIVFSTMALSSFSSGALVSAAGWDVMNWAALPFLALVAGRRSGTRASGRAWWRHRPRLLSLDFHAFPEGDAAR